MTLTLKASHGKFKRSVLSIENPQMASEMIIAVKVHIFPRLSARIPSGNLDVDFHGFMGMEKAIA